MNLLNLALLGGSLLLIATMVSALLAGLVAPAARSESGGPATKRPL